MALLKVETMKGDNDNDTTTLDHFILWDWGQAYKPAELLGEDGVKSN